VFDDSEETIYDVVIFLQTIDFDMMSVINNRPLNRTERRKQRTRDTLLMSAMHVLAQRGYKKFSIKAVTELADVGYGTFYSYFDDRDDIIWAILHQQFEQSQQHIASQINAMDSPERELTGWRIFFENIQQHQAQFTALFGEAGSVKLRYKFEAYIAEVYRRNIKARQYTMLPAYVGLPDDYLAHFMAGAQMQLVWWWLASDDSYTPDELARMLYQTVYHTTLDS